jgi:sugar lactone lactonase YvrE
MAHSRRRFLTRLGGGVALVILAPGCDELKGALSDADVALDVPDVDLPDVDLPGLAELDLGDAHLAFDLSGAIYRIYPEQNAIARVETDLTTERWRYGSLDTQTLLNFPANLVAGKDGVLHVMDLGNQRVVTLSSAGALVTTMTGLPSGARDGALDSDGNLWVAVPNAGLVQSFKPDGSAGPSVGAPGTEDNQLNGPRSVAIDADGRLHVVDAGNRRIAVFERSGAFVRSYGGTGDDGFSVPRSIAIDPLGNVYVADAVGGALHVFGKDGARLQRFADLAVRGIGVVPLDLSFSGGGLLYVRAVPKAQA